MEMNHSVPKPMGFFTVELVDPSGKVVQREYSKNIITYTATNIFARSLGGDATYNPTHILVGGDAAILGPTPTVTREDTILSASSTITEALPIVSRSYTSAPTDTNTVPEQQNNNVVTFTAIMPGFPDNALLNNKFFFEAAIITRIGVDDLLMTHQFHADIQKLEGFQLVYSWSIRFL